MQYSLKTEATDSEYFVSGENDEDRAKYAYFKGKALSCLSTTSHKAEEWLYKAVKLNPRNFEAWTVLGHCLWAKGQLAQARSCFLTSLEQAESAEALRQLSMIVRQIQQANVNPATILDESIRHAKRSIELEPNNHKSWYVLGNAHCTRFFSVSHDMMDLKKSLMCYQKSENFGGSINPDLYFNRGNVLRYMQQYSAAVEAYSRAASIDPNIEQTADAIDEITEFVSRTRELVASSGKLKKKKLSAMTTQLQQEIAASAIGISLDSDLEALGCKVSTSQAFNTSAVKASSADREYPGVSIALKVVLAVTKGTVPPESFLCVDAKGAFVVVSVYNLAVNGASQFNTDETVVVVDPRVKDVYFSQGNKSGEDTSLEVCFSIIQVVQLEKISVGGKFLNRAGIAAPTLSVDVFAS